MGGQPSQDVVATVVALTHQPDESYEQYIEKVACDDLAREVKLADLADNLANNRRLASTPEVAARIDRYRAGGPSSAIAAPAECWAWVSPAARAWSSLQCWKRDPLAGRAAARGRTRNHGGGRLGWRSARSAGSTPPVKRH